jgi:hypothetical protein
MLDFPVAAPLRYLTDEAGVRTDVVISLADYEEMLEDLEDLAAIANRRGEPTTSHEDFMEELKRDGLLPR